jgi:hypothetical protein
MTRDDILALKALAEKATPGPWTFQPQETEIDGKGNFEPYTAANVPEVFTFDTGDGFNGLEDDTARYIAACSPERILGLCDVALKVETVRREAEEPDPCE